MKPINLISVAIAVASGIITLLLLFFGAEVGLADALPILLGWTTTLAAVALLVGVGNLLGVQFRKISALNLTSFYSVVFFIAFFGVLFMWLLAATMRSLPTEVIPADDAVRTQSITLGQGAVDFAFNYIQTPVEATLTALLAIVMVLGGARLIRTRRSFSAGLFIGVAIILILVIAPIGGIGALNDIRNGINDLFVVGATRGILLAISLGVVATGIRIITGVDQPYGE